MNHNELRKLVKELSNKEYRRGFVEGHAKDTIAFQVRQLRKGRGWEQRDLAKALGNPKLQPMVSRYENPDYGRYSIATLLDLATAFDVALVVRFAPFSELVEWDLTATPQTLSPAPYSEDARLLEFAEQALTSVSRTAAAGFGTMAAHYEARIPSGSTPISGPLLQEPGDQPISRTGLGVIGQETRAVRGVA